MMMANRSVDVYLLTENNIFLIKKKFKKKLGFVHINGVARQRGVLVEKKRKKKRKRHQGFIRDTFNPSIYILIYKPKLF